MKLRNNNSKKPNSALRHRHSKCTVQTVGREYATGTSMVPWDQLIGSHKEQKGCELTARDEPKETYANIFPLNSPRAMTP